MLKQHVHHSLEGHSGKTSHLICSTQSHTCHKGKCGHAHTHKHTQCHKHRPKEHWFIYFFKTDLCLLICPPLFRGGGEPHWNNFVMLPGSSQMKPHSSTITTSADDVLTLLSMSLNAVTAAVFFLSSAHHAHTNIWLCFDCGLSMTLESHL